MNIIEKYYIKKANLGQSDDYHTRIDSHDIDLLRKAQFYIFFAPACTLGVMYLGSKLKNEMLMTQHFYFYVKRA